MKTKLEILKYIFDPVSEDCQTEKQDLQLAITLSPNIDRILFAMEEFGKQQYNQALEDAINNVTFNSIGGVDFSHTFNKQSILELKKDASNTD